MNPLPASPSTSRESLSTPGRIAAVSALAGVALPSVHAAGSDLIQLALVGCGGRGTGAAADALRSKGGPVKLVAMADVFENRMSRSFESVSDQCGKQVEVPPDRRFIGFDAYKKAMDCLKPGDVAIFATPLAFRWVHFTYAIEKGLNVFMEKPLTADGPTSRKMLKLGEAASAKNLKVAVGLMTRHARPFQELHKRIQDGEIGEPVLMRAYRMSGPSTGNFATKWPGGDPSELLWQIRRFHSFLWASGGVYSDNYIHHIDQLCWLKNAWPVKASGLGGRHYRYDGRGNLCVDQNFDWYSVEYIFEDGTRMIVDGRGMARCNDIYSSYVHGTKGMAIAAKFSDCGAPSSTFKGQKMQQSNLIWTSKTAEGETNPYQNEWNDLMDAIRNDKPYSEVEYGVKASVTSSMGRMAAHTGQEISFEDMLNHDHEYAPGIDQFTMSSLPPLKAGADGRYPVPAPGIKKQREF